MKEGMFRIPGRMTEILEMKISFEQGKIYVNFYITIH